MYHVEALNYEDIKIHKKDKVNSFHNLITVLSNLFAILVTLVLFFLITPKTESKIDNSIHENSICSSKDQIIRIKDLSLSCESCSSEFNKSIIHDNFALALSFDVNYMNIGYLRETELFNSNGLIINHTSLEYGKVIINNFKEYISYNGLTIFAIIQLIKLYTDLEVVIPGNIIVESIRKMHNLDLDFTGDILVNFPSAIGNLNKVSLVILSTNLDNKQISLNNSVQLFISMDDCTAISGIGVRHIRNEDNVQIIDFAIDLITSFNKFLVWTSIFIESAILGSGTFSIIIVYFRRCKPCWFGNYKEGIYQTFCCVTK
jgi:hypothetical protein